MYQNTVHSPCIATGSCLCGISQEHNQEVSPAAAHLLTTWTYMCSLVYPSTATSTHTSIAYQKARTFWVIEPKTCEIRPWRQYC